jgi:predicted transcriptional regulator YdeE
MNSGPPLEPIRYEDGPPMLLAGLRRHHSFAEAVEGIAAQWDAFRALGPVPGQKDGPLYGVICGGDEQARTLEYMCAAEVDAFDPAATHLGRMRVPPQHYAVFEHRGPASGLQATWQAIWNDWLPRSGRVPVHGPEFELYRGSDVIEVWSPIQP